MNVDNKVKSFSLKSSADLAPLIERIGYVHYVLLGEASHGMHEYYNWRSAITRRLIANKLLLLDGQYMDERFEHPMLHRAIGVVYHPLHEKHRNYVPSILNARYNAFIYLDKTGALYPLQIEPDRYKMPETYPFGY